MSVTVKICGITSETDALAAVEAGADAIGLMFYDGSPRYVTIEQAKAICAVLPTHIMRVGVFVNADEAFINRALNECLLNIGIYFHIFIFSIFYFPKLRFSKAYYFFNKIYCFFDF